MKRIALLVIGLLAIALAALAQSEAEPGGESPSDSGFLVRQLENSLSGPGRTVRFENTRGVISSSARVGRITVADDAGVWLELNDVALDWSRLQLLRARLQVNSLSAASGTWFRLPQPQRQPGVVLPEAEARPFSLPQLPVSVEVRNVQVDRFTFGEPVFGQAADLALSGAVTLASGVLDSRLDVRRLDGPGGTLGLTAAFSNATRALNLDVALSEPAGGIAATLLRIEGRPALDLTLAGSGPLDNLDLTLALDADKTRLVDGTLGLRGTEAGLGFTVAVDGDISPLVPPDFRSFFGPGTIDVSGLRLADGGLRIDTARVKGPVLTLDGRLEAAPGFQLTRLDLTGQLGDPAAPPITLPVAGGATRLNGATLRVNFGESTLWDGLLVLDRFETGGIRMEDVTVSMGGRARDLADPEKRDVSLVLEGLATGVGSQDPRIAAALGNRLDFFADVGLPAEGPVNIRQAQLGGNGVSLFASGLVRDLAFDGRAAARLADLAVLRGLTGRDLSGALRLNLVGSASPLTRGFDMTFDGEGEALRLGQPRVDGLLAGTTRLSGRAVRDETGFRTEDLTITNPQMSLTSNGIYSTARTDIGFEARINDLAVVDPAASGALTARGSAAGAGRTIDLSLAADMPEGSLGGREVSGLALGFDGRIDGSDIAGSLNGGGSLGDQPLTMAGDIALAGSERKVSGLRIGLGPSQLAGDLVQSGSAPVIGQLTLTAPDLAPVAALALTEASGAVDADIRLSGEGTRQDAAIQARARNVAVAGTRIDDFTADLRVTDARGVPMAEGTVNGTGLAVAGLDIASLALTATQDTPERMDVVLDGRMTNGTLLDASGSLARPDASGLTATLATLNLRQEAGSATLTAPVTLEVAQTGTVTLSPLTLDFGDGMLTAVGSAGDTLDLALDVQTLPLALANGLRPELGLGGQVSGTARVTGPRASPDITFDLAGTGVTAAAARAAGLPPLEARATGRTEAGRRLALDASVSGSGLDGRLTGTAPLGDGALDLAVDLRSFPLQLVDRAAGQRGLSGTVSGTMQITGPLAAPRVAFDLAGTGLGDQMTRSSGIPAIDLTAAGAVAGNALTLDRAQARGAGGLSLDARGTVPFAGTGLDLRFEGSLPLSLADPFLADRAAQATGNLRLSGSASGSLQAPRLSGGASLAGGSFTDPGTNLRLQGVTAEATFEGDTVRLQSARADVVGGGAVTASGRIGLAPAAGFPTDFDVQMRGVRYTDGAFVTTVVTGDLNLAGTLRGTSTLSGVIDLGPTEISISSSLGGASTAIVDQVDHIRPPARVLETLSRARVDERDTASASQSRMLLDLRVRAPNQIFVRGRGLDAELGGELTIRGSTSDVQPVGQFDLRRGQIVLAAQRIEFTEGSLVLLGDLDPRINFQARTQSGDVVAIVTVTGRASSPDITFSSEPPLPQDEVLSRLLFNRATQNLTPFQAAQLASTAAELSGQGGPGILSQLRSSVGLDDLDVITTDTGGTAVQAGKYLDDNIYLDVQTGSDGITRAEIVLDLTDSVTARGSVSSEGDSTLGLFYERDY